MRRDENPSRLEREKNRRMKIYLDSVAELEANEKLAQIHFRNYDKMLASTSRPMPTEAAARRSGRAVSVGGSPTRRTTAAKRSSNPRRRRLVSSSPAVGARSSSTSTAVAVRASSSSSSDDALPSPATGSRKRVVILGGTGRVGASTALQLAKGPGGDQLDLVLVGKPGSDPPPSSSSSSSSSFASASAAVSSACKKFPALSRAIVAVAAVDSGDAKALEELFKGASCVIHCAGPFQSGGGGAAAAAAPGGNNGAQPSVPAPLAAAIRAKVPYVDVCDDPDWAKVREGERDFLREETNES